MVEERTSFVSAAARLNVLVTRLRELETTLRSADFRDDPFSESSWLVTFRIGDARYALPLGQTREVVRFAKLTPVPSAPQYLLGMLNLRGSARPVVDPLMLWGGERLVPSLHSAIVVVEACSRVYGILVDHVEDVVSSSTIEVTSENGDAGAEPTLSSCVTKTLRDGANLFHVLDPARLLAPALIAELDEALTRALERATIGNPHAEVAE